MRWTPDRRAPTSSILANRGTRMLDIDDTKTSEEPAPARRLSDEASSGPFDGSCKKERVGPR